MSVVNRKCSTVVMSFTHFTKWRFYPLSNLSCFIFFSRRYTFNCLKHSASEVTKPLRGLWCILGRLKAIISFKLSWETSGLGWSETLCFFFKGFGGINGLSPPSTTLATWIYLLNSLGSCFLLVMLHLLSQVELLMMDLYLPLSWY